MPEREVPFSIRAKDHHLDFLRRAAESAQDSAARFAAAMKNIEQAAQRDDEAD